MRMKSHDTRLQRLEVAQWRRSAALAGEPHGYSADVILEESIRFLEIPLDQRLQAYPHFTEAEHREMQTWLPTIRRARWAGRC
jgi:hypothetical protein